MTTISRYNIADSAVWNQMVRALIKPDIMLLDSALVDNHIWHTVKLSVPASQWLVCQPVNEWYAHSDCFDVSDQLYTALNLKWK